MSRFFSLRGRACPRLVLASLAAPWFTACGAPTYVMGSEDDTAPNSGGVTSVGDSSSLNRGSSGAGSSKSTSSASSGAIAARGGMTAATRTAETDPYGGTSFYGGAHNSTTGSPQWVGGQGGIESTSLTSLERSIGVGGAGGAGGLRAAGGNTAVAQTIAHAGGTPGSGGLRAFGSASNSGGSTNTGATTSPPIATGGATNTRATATGGGGTNTGGVATTGGTLGTGGANASGGTTSTGGVIATGGIAASGGSKATGGTPGSGGSSTAGTYCTAYVDLGTRGSTSTEYKPIPTAATCYRFTVAAGNEVFRGIQMSNCDTRTVSINGVSPGCAPSTNCSAATYIPRAEDGYFYVKFSAGSSTNCTSTWWWSP